MCVKISRPFAQWICIIVKSLICIHFRIVNKREVKIMFVRHNKVVNSYWHFLLKFFFSPKSLLAVFVKSILNANDFNFDKNIFFDLLMDQEDSLIDIERKECVSEIQLCFFKNKNLVFLIIFVMANVDCTFYICKVNFCSMFLVNFFLNVKNIAMV